MKIWQLNFEVDLYDNLVPVPKLSVEELQTFDGRSHLSHWSPLTCGSYGAGERVTIK